MPFALRPQETAFYPQPFVDTEVHLLVITNQRVVQFSDEGKQEMEAREVTFVGRVSERPLLIAGIVAVLVGLPLLVAGVYVFLTVKAPLALPAGVALPGSVPLPGGLQLPGAAPAAPAAADDDDPGSPGADDPADPAEPVASAPPSPGHPGAQRATGIVMVLLGFILAAGGGLMAARQRHVVLVRGGPKVMKIRAGGKMEQTQILATLQAVQSAGKAAAPAPSQAKPKVQVDDGGDPVKALQELAAKRAAGKMGEDEFVAKREVLLDRLKNRKV